VVDVPGKVERNILCVAMKRNTVCTVRNNLSEFCRVRTYVCTLLQSCEHLFRDKLDELSP